MLLVLSPLILVVSNSFLITEWWVRQSVNNVRYDTESRIEWCSSEGQPRPCYLFARKFTRGAAFQLLDLVPSYEKAEYTH
jgi:hypothetical protein